MTIIKAIGILIAVLFFAGGIITFCTCLVISIGQGNEHKMRTRELLEEMRQFAYKRGLNDG